MIVIDIPVTVTSSLTMSYVVNGIVIAMSYNIAHQPLNLDET